MKISLFCIIIFLITVLFFLGCTQPDFDSSDEPYSFLAVHFEIIPKDSEATDRWQNMVTMVDLANQYNTPLTIMFWPGSARYALASPERIVQVREWQAQGHEIGLHNQGCYNEGECKGVELFNPEYYDGGIYELGDFEPLDGTYKLKVRETIHEADYFDEAKLVLVDAPKGYDVFNTWGFTSQLGYASPKDFMTVKDSKKLLFN